MSCEKLGEIKQLVVERPDQLRDGPLSAHLLLCDVCTAEVAAMEHTLTVFTQLEQERLSRAPSGPSWEQLCSVLKEQKGQKSTRPLTLLAAAVLVAFIVGVSTTWVFFPTDQAGTSEIAKNTLIEQKEGQSPEEKQPRASQLVESSQNGVWGELRIKVDGTLEVVTEKTSNDIINHRSLNPRWELPSSMPPTIPVSNR